MISTIAGRARKGITGDGGPAGAAYLSNPRGLALDPWGRLLVADKGNSVIRVISPAGPAPVEPAPEPGS